MLCLVRSTDDEQYRPPEYFADLDATGHAGANVALGLVFWRGSGWGAVMRFAFVIAMLAAPALAQGANEADLEAMIAAVEAAGCFVTADNGDAVLAASGLDTEQTMAVIAQLYSDGLVALTPDGHMKLTNETCQ